MEILLSFPEWALVSFWTNCLYFSAVDWSPGKKFNTISTFTNIPFNIANILFYFNPYLNNWIISARFNKSQIWKILPGLEFEILDRAVSDNFVTWPNLDEIFHLSDYTFRF